MRTDAIGAVETKTIKAIRNRLWPAGMDFSTMMRGVSVLRVDGVIVMIVVLHIWARALYDDIPDPTRT